MRSILVVLLAFSLWGGSLFIRVGSLQTSQIKHTWKTIYVASAYEWIPELVHDPLAALSSALGVIIFAVLLVIDLLHIGFCLALAWAIVRAARIR